MEPVNPSAWSLFIDRSSGKRGSRARVVLVSSEGYKLNCAVRSSISKGEEVPHWMQQIITFLKDQELHEDREEVRKLGRRSTQYVLMDEVLYKRGLLSPLLRESSVGTLGLNWEGPYLISDELRSGTLRIESLDRKCNPPRMSSI
ncbi:unnamed protein product [Fraxinus pennsylvanica]|uniref:Uncharacterized protein n=1 Tax=Fraxinus pennsylvanica TaxID=56036 RepID=A0AAD2A6S8_9LAMI|nr:unnamed protein product [Fraxinus pennsylvanica]